MSPQDKYHETMNILLTPVRFAIGMIEVSFLYILAIVVALAWPLLMYMNHQPVTFGTFVVPLLAILFLFTFFCAPWYTVIGGFLFIFSICGWALAYNFPDATEFKWLCLGFLLVGIIQWRVRRKPPMVATDVATQLCKDINQDRLRRKTLQYQNMGPLRRKTLTTLYGEDYMTWPED